MLQADGVLTLDLVLPRTVFVDWVQAFMYLCALSGVCGVAGSGAPCCGWDARHASLQGWQKGGHAIGRGESIPIMTRFRCK